MEPYEPSFYIPATGYFTSRHFETETLGDTRNLAKEIFSALVTINKLAGSQCMGLHSSGW